MDEHLRALEREMMGGNPHLIHRYLNCLQQRGEFDPSKKVKKLNNTIAQQIKCDPSLCPNIRQKKIKITAQCWSMRVVAEFKGFFPTYGGHFHVSRVYRKGPKRGWFGEELHILYGSMISEYLEDIKNLFTLTVLPWLKSNEAMFHEKCIEIAEHQLRSEYAHYQQTAESLQHIELSLFESFARLSRHKQELVAYESQNSSDAKRTSGSPQQKMEGV